MTEMLQWLLALSWIMVINEGLTLTLVLRLLGTHPRCAGCRRSRCGNCGTGLSILAGSWGARKGKEGRGRVARPEARGCW